MACLSCGSPQAATNAIGIAPLPPLQLLQNFPAGTAVSTYTQNIRSMYETLRISWGTANLATSLYNIEKLRCSLFQEQASEALDEDNLISTLRDIRNKLIQMFDTCTPKLLMWDLFRSTLERISQRCSLSFISKEIANKNGWGQIYSPTFLYRMYLKKLNLEIQSSLL